MKFYIVKTVKDYKYKGNTRAFVITLNEKYKDDKGLLAHEVEHVKQWYFVFFTSFLLISFLFNPLVALPFSLLVWPFLYGGIPLFRKWSEVFAFRKTIEHSEDKEKALRSSAKKLSSGYNLKLTYDEAVSLLKKAL
jgi:hypothetical protein